MSGSRALTCASPVAVSDCGSSCSLSLDHLHPPPPPPCDEQLCYVHCHLCDTVLAVSVPSSSLLKTVTVRCGHCSNLLMVNMRALLLPPPPPPMAAPSSTNSLFCPLNPNGHLQRGTPNPAPNFHLAEANNATNYLTMRASSSSSTTRGGSNGHLPRSPCTTRPPEKRQRVPSAYNRFIKEEIQRIKAGNPDISHREAFSTAAKNWAHFPHIQFGLMSDQTVKRTTNIRAHNPHSQDSGEEVRIKDGFFAASANIGVYPY